MLSPKQQPPERRLLEEFGDSVAEIGDSPTLDGSSFFESSAHHNGSEEFEEPALPEIEGSPLTNGSFSPMLGESPKSAANSTSDAPPELMLPSPLKRRPSFCQYGSSFKATVTFRPATKRIYRTDINMREQHRKRIKARHHALVEAHHRDFEQTDSCGENHEIFLLALISEAMRFFQSKRYLFVGQGDGVQLFVYNHRLQRFRQRLKDVRRSIQNLMKVSDENYVDACLETARHRLFEVDFHMRPPRRATHSEA